MLQIIGHDSPRFTIHDASLRTKLLLQDRQNAAVLAALDADGNKLQLGRELRVHVWILATASEKYAHLLEHWPPSVVQSLAMALVPGAPAETIPRLLDMLYTEELPPDLDWWDLLALLAQADREDMPGAVQMCAHALEGMSLAKWEHAAASIPPEEFIAAAVDSFVLAGHVAAAMPCLRQALHSAQQVCTIALVTALGHVTEEGSSPREAQQVEYVRALEVWVALAGQLMDAIGDPSERLSFWEGLGDNRLRHLLLNQPSAVAAMRTHGTAALAVCAPYHSVAQDVMGRVLVDPSRVVADPACQDAFAKLPLPIMEAFVMDLYPIPLNDDALALVALHLPDATSWKGSWRPPFSDGFCRYLAAAASLGNLHQLLHSVMDRRLELEAGWRRVASILRAKPGYAEHSLPQVAMPLVGTAARPIAGVAMVQRADAPNEWIEHPDMAARLMAGRLYQEDPAGRLYQEDPGR